MKRFGKVFGIGVLAFATLTAGVVGLSGCGERWKNPDKDDMPEEPPAIVVPPEEKPLIGVVSLKEIQEYLSDSAVKTTFDGLKIVSSVPENESGVCGHEFYAVVGETPAQTKMAVKTLYENANAVTNFIKGDEKAVYVKSETATEVLTEKLTTAEEVEIILSDLNTIYTNAIDVKTQFDGVFAEWQTLDNFRYSAVRTRLGENVSFEIVYSYTAKEEDAQDPNIVTDVNYTGKANISFENSAVVKYETILTRQEKGSLTKETYKNMAENLTDFELPSDLDTYAEQITLESFKEYLNYSSTVSIFDKLGVTITEDGHKDRIFMAVKDGEFIRAKSKNVDQEDDVVYYYLGESGKAYKEVGEELVEIADETELENFAKKNNEAFEGYSNVSLIIGNLLAESEASTNKDIVVKKKSQGNRLEFAIEFSYDVIDSVDGMNYNYSGTMILIFEDNMVQLIDLVATQKVVETGEIIMEPKVVIERIDSLVFPEFPASPEVPVEPEIPEEGGEIA